MARPSKLVPTTATSDGLIATGTIKVYLVVHWAGATGGTWQLNDSLDDSGNDIFPGTTAATSVPQMLMFDPPMEFRTGLYADIPGTNVTLIIGHSA